MGLQSAAAREAERKPTPSSSDVPGHETGHVVAPPAVDSSGSEAGTEQEETLRSPSGDAEQNTAADMPPTSRGNGNGASKGAADANIAQDSPASADKAPSPANDDATKADRAQAGSDAKDNSKVVPQAQGASNGNGAAQARSEAKGNAKASPPGSTHAQRLIDGVLEAAVLLFNVAVLVGDAEVVGRRFQVVVRHQEPVAFLGLGTPVRVSGWMAALR